jgi:hypothetical protein
MNLDENSLKISGQIFLFEKAKRKLLTYIQTPLPFLERSNLIKSLNLIANIVI